MYLYYIYLFECYLLNIWLISYVELVRSVIFHVYTHGSGHCCLICPTTICNAPRFPSFHVHASSFLFFFLPFLFLLPLFHFRFSHLYHIMNAYSISFTMLPTIIRMRTDEYFVLNFETI